MLEEKPQNIKMFGYMEKRGKMTIRGRWKRRWCVLEGHLLLYYKSQTEYLKLSPCCGSLNVTLVRKIQPDVGCLIHITTHSQIIILRTPNKEKQGEWFHALASVLPQNNHERLLYNESLFPTMPSHRKAEKRKKGTTVTGFRKDEYRYFHISEETNHHSKESGHIRTISSCTSNETGNTNSQCVLQNISNNKIIYRSSSESDIPSSSIKNNLKQFKRSFSCGSVFTSFSKNNINAENCVHDEFTYQEKRISMIKNNNSLVRSGECSVRKSSKKKNKSVVVQRRSFGFLKKFLLRRKSRRLRKEAQKQNIKSQDLRNSCLMSKLAVISIHDIKEESEKISPFLESAHEKDKIVAVAEELVSITKTSQSIKTEGSQSWTTSQSDENSPNDLPPELPKKIRKNCQHYDWQNEVIQFHSETEDSHTVCNPNAELDKLMSQLTDLNKEQNFLENNSIHSSENEIPDYDIPRSHLSIISEVISEKTNLENSTTNSPDYKYDELSVFDMAPDSLEMPWLADDSLNNNKYWPATNDHHFFLRNDIESDNDDTFLDSLNTINQS